MNPSLLPVPLFLGKVFVSAMEIIPPLAFIVAKIFQPSMLFLFVQTAEILKSFLQSFFFLGRHVSYAVDRSLESVKAFGRQFEETLEQQRLLSLFGVMQLMPISLVVSVAFRWLRSILSAVFLSLKHHWQPRDDRDEKMYEQSFFHSSRRANMSRALSSSRISKS